MGRDRLSLAARSKANDSARKNLWPKEVERKDTFRREGEVEKNRNKMDGRRQDRRREKEQIKMQCGAQ